MRDLATRMRDQAVMCRDYGSHLNGSLLEHAADDLEAGGVVAQLMSPHAADPSGSVPPLRFVGALHRLVLERAAPELATHYPSVGGTAPVEEAWPAAERACREHLDRLRVLVTQPVQTNEVGRSAVLFGLLQLLEGPVQLLEIGSSAGLNLRCDRYAYEVGDTVRGDASSPLRLVQPWEGAWPPDRPVQLVSRKGCDPNPLDPTTTEGRLVLTSYVWPDQVERVERLRGALDVASRVPAQVERAGALYFLRRELDARPEGVTTLVWHSVVMQYVDPGEREAVAQLLADHGSRATDDAPLVRASMEPERDGDAWVFAVRLQRWPGGESVLVARAQGHGPPVVWAVGR